MAMLLGLRAALAGLSEGSVGDALRAQRAHERATLEAGGFLFRLRPIRSRRQKRREKRREKRRVVLDGGVGREANDIGEKPREH